MDTKHSDDQVHLVSHSKNDQWRLESHKSNNTMYVEKWSRIGINGDPLASEYYEKYIG